MDIQETKMFNRKAQELLESLYSGGSPHQKYVTDVSRLIYILEDLHMGNLSDWSAVSGVISGSIDLYHLIKEHIPRTSSPEKEVPPTPVSPPVQEEQKQVGQYKTQLGPRHKTLREDILDLSPREMADFYGFEETEQLERCEAGLAEFPTEAMKRLEEFFFINPKYLQKGENFIFQPFINYPRDDCRRFLEQGFEPYFLCDPSFQSFQKDGLAYLVFSKKDEGYWRMIHSNTVDSFYSKGAANSICSLINSMLDLNTGLRWSNLLCLNASEEEWEDLSKGHWYNKGMRGYPGYHNRRTVNHEATEIYERWFRDFRTDLMSRNKKFYLP